MPTRKNKNVDKKQEMTSRRGRSRERRRSPSCSSSFSEFDRDVSVDDVVHFVESCKTWHDVLRSDFLFQENFYADHLNYLKQVFETRLNANTNDSERKKEISVVD